MDYVPGLVSKAVNEFFLIIEEARNNSIFTSNIKIVKLVMALMAVASFGAIATQVWSVFSILTSDRSAGCVISIVVIISNIMLLLSKPICLNRIGSGVFLFLVFMIAWIAAISLTVSVSYSFFWARVMEESPKATSIMSINLSTFNANFGSLIAMLSAFLLSLPQVFLGVLYFRDVNVGRRSLIEKIDLGPPSLATDNIKISPIFIEKQKIVSALRASFQSIKPDEPPRRGLLRR